MNYVINIEIVFNLSLFRMNVFLSFRIASLRKEFLEAFQKGRQGVGRGLVQNGKRILCRFS